jgi:N-acetylmuramic acid 6-phosphate etherase
MNREDAAVAPAVEQALPAVARLVNCVAARLREGGRLFYVGAGTSGRLGLLDAVECPPTFGVEPERVQCLMAGSAAAWERAVEGAEDDEAAGGCAVADAGISAQDALIGIAASGRTPFVLGAVREARSRGCATGAITNYPGSPLGQAVDIAVEVAVGPEVLTGSSRLKAGTAQKMVLNMISTAVMVQLGKAYGNLMVDVRATNVKLTDRARRIVAEISGLPLAEAAAYLEQSGGSAKTAAVMARLHCGRAEAEARLVEAGGALRRVLEAAGLD